VSAPEEGAVLGVAVGLPEHGGQRFYPRGRAFVFDSSDEDLTVYGPEPLEGEGSPEVLALFPRGGWAYAEKVYPPTGVKLPPEPLGSVSRAGRP